MKNAKILLAGPGTGKTTKIKEIIREHHDPSKILVVSFTNATVNDLLSDFKKDNLSIDEKSCMTLHKYALTVNHRKANSVLTETETEILTSYAKWANIEFEQLCRILNCMTFEQMVTDCSEFIETNPIYAKETIGNIELFIVDEYQDFNETERKFISAISQYSNETIILGDDDQCIYGFKNADSEGIITLHENESIQKILHENICYRCPDDVVTAGINLISKNKKRVKKDWHKSNRDGYIQTVQHISQKETAQYICSEISNILSTEPESSIMILSPTRHIVNELIDEMNSCELPHTDWISRQTDFPFLQKISYLRAIFGEEKLLNILLLSFPTLKKNYTKRKKFITVLGEVVQQDVKKTSNIERLLSLNTLDEEMASLITNEPTVEKFFENHPEYAEFKEHLENEYTREEKLRKLEQILSQHLDFNHGIPNLMSIHKSKGLSADYVFIIGLVDGIFPRDSKGLDTVEAERRLLYVGMTRAKKGLYLVSTVEWDGKVANKFDKTKFGYKGKIRTAQSSIFLREMKEKATI